MNIKKFLMVFCPLMLVWAMVVGAVSIYGSEAFQSSEQAKQTVINRKSNILGSSENTPMATGTYNVLLVGRDVGGKLTDTIMFVRVDNDKGKVSILSIPRDTYVDGWKINAMYSLGGEKGIQNTVECVEDLVGLEIDYYVSISTATFREIVDELDGVQFYVPQNMDYEDPVQGLYIHLTEGDQLLDGDKAEQLVRFRSYIQGDIQRTQVQRDFIQALIEQKKSPKYIDKVDDIYRAVADDIETNLTITEILANIGVFRNLDTENKLKAHIMPNDPQNVGGISYVFVIDTELRELLMDEFGVKKSEFNVRSGEHVYTVGGGGYTSYAPDYDDSTAWFEPEIPEEDITEDVAEGAGTTDEDGELNESGELDESEESDGSGGDTAENDDITVEPEFPDEPETSDTPSEEGVVEEPASPEDVPEVSEVPQSPVSVDDTNIYEEYPDAAGVPLD